MLFLCFSSIFPSGKKTAASRFSALAIRPTSATPRRRARLKTFSIPFCDDKFVSGVFDLMAPAHCSNLRV
jgi:hypothetical protein